MLEFRRPFGDINLPELSEAEIWQAMGKYDELFEELFTAHPRYTSVEEDRHRVARTLLLQVEQGNSLIVLAEVKKKPTKEIERQNVALRFSDNPASRLASLCMYYWYSDAIRREDHDSARKRLIEEAVDSEEDKHRRRDEEAANSELEVQMGLRLGPVGPKEIAGLRTFMLDGTPQHSPSFSPRRNIQNYIDKTEDRKDR